MSSPPAAPYWREAGAGPAVVCLHANASVSGQWRPLMSRLADRRRLLAPDGYGAGRSPEWPSDRTITLADEVRLIEPVLALAGERYALVGHSYGGAVALRAAAQQPDRVSALVLYEPTLFALIDAEGPAPNDADGIRQAAATATAALDAGDTDAAARVFIDYWTGPGSWDHMLEDLRPEMARSITKLRRWGHALFNEPMPLAPLPMPVLIMTGAASTAAAHGVARRLIAALPKVTHIEFPGLGHMGPITHPDVVNAEIERFLLAAT
ncbi:MAG: alpha/beta hydrolase [Rubrivivax sp.]|nr:alpha/beta hydrolase [Rubrivivax sp.]